MNRWRSSPHRSVSLPRADIPLLDVDRLTIRTDKTVLVDEVEFDAIKGSMVAILGAGRGRRTAVLDCIGNIRPASSGAVRVEGHRLKRAFTAATFWGVLGTGLLVGLLAAAAAVDVDRLWLATVKRGLAVDEPFTPATFGQRIRSYFRAELAIDRLAGNWRIVTADGRKVLAVHRDLEEARELRHQLQAAVTARRTGPGTIPDLSDLVGDANEPRRRLPLDEATFAQLAGGKSLIRLRGWTALGAGVTLGIALALAFWQRGRRSAQVAACAGVARTFHQPRVFPEMTVFENVLVATERKASSTNWLRRLFKRGETNSVEEAKAWLLWCDLANSGEQPAGELSWFDRRRLELARAMAIHPRLLLVDDPAEGLDVDQQQAIAMLLQDAQERGVTIVLTAGTVGPLTEVCDRTIFLERQPAC